MDQKKIQEERRSSQQKSIPKEQQNEECLNSKKRKRSDENDKNLHQKDSDSETSNQNDVIKPEEISNSDERNPKKLKPNEISSSEFSKKQDLSLEISKFREILLTSLKKKPTNDNMDPVSQILSQFDIFSSKIESFFIEKDDNLEKENKIASLEIEIEKIKREKAGIETKLKETLRENQILLKENDGMSKEISKFDSQIGKSFGAPQEKYLDFDAKKVKVLHFTENPEQWAADQESKMASLMSENEKIKKQLKDVVSLTKRKNFDANSAQQIQEIVLSTKEEDSMNNCTVSQQSKDIEEIKQNYDLRIQRLKEVFQKKISDFRKAVYLIFGVRIDMISDDTYKLTSIYMTNEDDFLLFSVGKPKDNKDETTNIFATTNSDEKKDAGNEVNVLVTDFLLALSKEALCYIKFGSVPAFLASIQMELFNKTTVALMK